MSIAAALTPSLNFPGPLLLHDRLLRRLAIAAPLIFAAYVVLQCPCPRLPACKKELFFGSIAVSLLFVLAELRGSPLLLG